MPLGNFGQPMDANASLKDILDAFSRLQKEVTYLLNGGLDTVNVNELNAEVINAGTLNAGLVTVRADYAGGAFIELSSKGIRINDGTKDTFIANTDGNVTLTGTITGSKVIGSEVKTSETEYPRAEMSSTSQLFAAFRIATDFIKIHAKMTGSPTIEFDNGTAKTIFSAVNNTMIMNAMLGDIQIVSQAGKVRFSNWSNIFSNGGGQTLQNALDSKANGSGVSGTFQAADGKVIVVINGVITEMR